MTYAERHHYPRYYNGKKIPYSELATKRLKTERVFHFVGSTALVLSLVGGAVFGIGSGIRAIGGSYGKQFPEAKAQKLNLEKYTSAFQAASPAGKFVMQYLRTISVDHIEYPDAHGVTAGGVQAAGSDGAFWRTTVGNACLNNTAYDIAGGKIDFNLTYSSLFSYVSANAHGNVPTAAAFAEIDPNNPNDLIVQSGNNESVTLTFSGLQDRDTSALTPANTQTEDILMTYGCSIQPKTSEFINS